MQIQLIKKTEIEVDGTTKIWWVLKIYTILDALPIFKYFHSEESANIYLQSLKEHYLKFGVLGPYEELIKSLEI